MLHARTLLFMLPVAVAFLALPAIAPGHETGFLNRVVTVSGVNYCYQVYVPPNWSKKQKWPVMLFLHGAGERGDDGLIQTEVGIGTAIRRHQDRFPAIVVMPQCRAKVWWRDASMEAQALRALDDAMKEFKGDPARVYLTGLSMGGYAAWELGAKHPPRLRRWFRSAVASFFPRTRPRESRACRPRRRRAIRTRPPPVGSARRRIGRRSRCAGHRIAKAGGSSQGGRGQRPLHRVSRRGSQLLGESLRGARIDAVAAGAAAGQVNKRLGTRG
jgi:pimeloyl-ACP methyl ester carboxylesterase